MSVADNLAKYWPGKRWHEVQIELEQSGQLDRNTQEIAAKLGVSLAPKGKEATEFAELYPAEILTYRMYQAGFIGYFCHLMVNPSDCLLASVRARSGRLVEYYIQRRAPVTAKIWQELYNWGYPQAFDYVEQHCAVDYSTCCQSICPDVEFIEHLIEKYQRTNKLQQLCWLMRLIGGALTIEQIESLGLSQFQLKECLKGMNQAEIKVAAARWGFSGPYIAGLIGEPEGYLQYLPTELWNVEMVSLENGPEKVEISESIFYRNGVPLSKGVDEKVDARRQLYLNSQSLFPLEVFRGLCDRAKLVPKEAKGLICSLAQHFSKPEDPVISYHNICWYRKILRIGRENADKTIRQKREADESYDLNYAREIVFAAALKESCIEVLQELYRDGPLDFGELLFKAKTSQIADWAFGLIVATGVRPTLCGIDLPPEDPYYKGVIAVHRKWFPSASYLPKK